MTITLKLRGTMIQFVTYSTTTYIMSTNDTDIFHYLQSTYRHNLQYSSLHSTQYTYFYKRISINS